MNQRPNGISLRDIEAVFWIDRDCDGIKIRFDMRDKGVSLTARLSPQDASRIGFALIDAARDALVARG